VARRRATPPRGLSALACAALVFAAAPQDGASAVEREWKIREAARSLQSWLDLGRDGSQRDWLDRAADLEALARAARAGAWDAADLASRDVAAAVERGIADPEPQVRIAAMDALAALFDRGAWAGRDAVLAAARRLDATLPSERIACVEAISRFGEWPDSSWPSLVAPLCRDGDGRVAEAVREAVLTRSADDADAVAEIFAHAVSDPDVERLADLFARLDRTAPSGERLRAVRATLERSKGLGERERARWIAVVDAMASRWHGADETGWIVEAWPGWPARLAGIAGRAALASRASKGSLGRALFACAERALDAEARDAYLRGAAQALDANEAAKLAFDSRSIDDAGRAVVLDELRGRSARFDLESMRRWLAPDVGRELRELAVVALRDCAAGELDDATRALLEIALDDPDPEIARLAFEALASAREIARSLAPMFAAWSRLDAPRRRAWLDELPRESPPAPFRAALRSIAAAGGDDGARAVELLATFGPDADLAADCALWLERELALFEGAGTGRRAHELRAMGLVRALHRLAGERAVETMARVAHRAGPASDDIGKLCVWSLGQSQAGRARLPEWLAEGAPSRLRIEAWLALAPHGSPPAIEWLARDFARCDWELKGRALRACIGLADAASFEFAAQAAASPTLAWELRALAVEALASRGESAVETLAGVARCGDLELERAAIEAIGSIGGERATAIALATLADSDARLARGGPDREPALIHRDAALAALARSRCFDERAIRAWIARPLDAAADDVRRRFAGESPAATEFAWRSELAYAAALVSAGRLRAALDASGPWRRLDSRLLSALGERAQAAGDVAAARELLVAALVAFEGEARTEARDAERFAARCRLIQLALERGAWGELSALAGAALGDWRAGRVGDRAVERALGPFDPSRELDPTALLETLRRVALGRTALARAERERAQEWAARARASSGYSARARSAVEELERALAEAK
jgi:hypothetical protein